jgi:hypothetical protein
VAPRKCRAKDVISAFRLAFEDERISVVHCVYIISCALT